MKGVFTKLSFNITISKIDQSITQHIQMFNILAGTFNVRGLVQIYFLTIKNLANSLLLFSINTVHL